MNYLTAINNFRGTASTNPEHNQHIWHIAQCIQEAFTASNLQYDMEIAELKQTIKNQDERIARLESIIQALEKKTPAPATPIAADVFITPSSLKQMRRDIINYLN